MQERIINVFYGNDALPYKDKERSVHFPIVGNAFMNSSNTTEIRFYCRDIGGDNRQWIVIGKLPNNKRGFKLLGSSQTDSVTGEKYFSFQLNQFFTQYKGDLFLSLGGFNGSLEELEEYDMYQLAQNSIIESTGAIKLNIAYSTPISGSDTEIDTWQAFLAELNDKAYKDQVIIQYELYYTLNGEKDNFENGQLFYCQETRTIYKLDSGELETQVDFSLMDRVGIVSISNSSGVLTEQQLSEANKPYCIIIDNNLIYIKQSDNGNNMYFYQRLGWYIPSGFDFYRITNHYYSVDKVTGNYSFVSKYIDVYDKSQAEDVFAQLGGNNTFTGSNVFNTSPQTNDSDYGDGTGTKLTTKNYVLGIKNDLDSEIADINKVIPSNADETHKLISSAEKGASNGVATLDSNQKVPVSQLPDSILGQVEYCGNFDASSNQNQTIRTPRKGDYYICNTSGYHLPTGVDTSDWQTPIDFELGDWAIYDGSAWEKIDNTDAVQSVNGETGAVVLDGTKIALSNNDTTKITTKLGNIDNDIATINSKLPQVKDYVVPTTAWALVNGKYVAELEAGVDFVIDDNAMKIYTPTSNSDQLLRDTYGINVSSDATTQKFTFTCNIGNEAPIEVINFTIAQFGGN